MWDAASALSALAISAIIILFDAYLDMSKFPTAALSPHARLIMTYTMCGFAVVGLIV